MTGITYTQERYILTGMEPLKRITTPTRLVLKALHAGRSYGLRLSGDCQLSTGTVYVILARLERHGLAASSWEAPGDRQPRSTGPVRRYWELTGDGRALAGRLP